MRYAGRVALVTGASSGLGRATALLLAVEYAAAGARFATGAVLRLDGGAGV
jgi:NAD(P)-dependent dehydrogenase (short-subunit alcohol dehydrogenase family)